MAWRNFQSRLHEIKITNNQLEEHVSSFKPRVVLKRVGISDASRVGLPRLFCKRVRIFFVLPGLDLKLDNIMVKIVLDLYGKYSEEHRINDGLTGPIIQNLRSSSGHPSGGQLFQDSLALIA
uniref:Uncharacterized protein n=1 Tax=Cacopsylla melanoneura TaxID=428564 RepID=A0A8D8TVT8_9HEMI